MGVWELDAHAYAHAHARQKPRLDFGEKRSRLGKRWNEDAPARTAVEVRALA